MAETDVARETVALRIAGRIFTGWEEVSVSRGLDRVAGGFSLTVSDKPWRVRPGDACTVEIAGETVITGWVDEVSPRYDSTQHSIAVAGRSRTADLIDCSSEISPGQWSGRRLEQIARALCAPFGIEVAIATETGEPFATFNLDQGESVHDALEELARLRGVLVTDDAAGRLVITRASRRRAATELLYGENVLGASGRFTMQDRFSRYTMKGQQKGTDFLGGDAAASVLARATDDGVARYRPLVVVATAPVDTKTAQELVVHEASVRMGRAAGVTYRVQGWRQADGRLWQPNELVRVRDPHMWLDRDMLIAAVEYAQGGSGTVANLAVVRPEAYERVAGQGVTTTADQWADLRKAVSGAGAPSTGSGSIGSGFGEGDG